MLLRERLSELEFLQKEKEKEKRMFFFFFFISVK